MTAITIRIDKETRRKMKEIKINWSAYVREAIWRKIEEEKRKNIAKAVLINEKLKRKSLGEMKAEEIIRKFRDECYARSSRRRKHNS